MKKLGFTLTEVLITLTIIGVVAALVAPALSGSVNKQKVGPSLRKIINTIEVANEHILADNDADTLSSITMNLDTYIGNLTKYVKGTPQNKTMKEYTPLPSNFKGKSDNGPYNMQKYKVFKLASGEGIGIALNSADELATAKSLAKGSYKGQYAVFYYDLNGYDTPPNRLGKDIFHMHIDDGGAVFTDGGRQQSDAMANREDVQAWKTSSWNRCSETAVDVGHSCAGSIADNDWKVIYKY